MRFLGDKFWLTFPLRLSSDMAPLIGNYKVWNNCETTSSCLGEIITTWNTTWNTNRDKVERSWTNQASFPGPKRGEEKEPGFSRSAHALNHGGISPPPHTIDTLPYACSANYTLRRFITAENGAWKESH